MATPGECWQRVCRLTDLEDQRAATVLAHGQAIALFRIDDRVFAVSNHDPFSRHSTIARGIVVARPGGPAVGSPTHRHTFDLQTGRCLEDDQVCISVYDVKVEDGVVLVGNRVVAAA